MNKKQDYINHDEITLLKSISDFKKDLSNKTIKNYIKNGLVKVNNKVITNSSLPLHDNDKIEITYMKSKINDYDLDDTLVVKPEELIGNTDIVNGQTGEEDGK